MRLALATVLLLGIFAVPGAARATGCDRVEPVFGLKDAGVLMEHDYCVEGHSGRFLPPRVIATFQNPSPPRLFWGGRLQGNLSVIYAVTADGRLKWGRQLPGNAGNAGNAGALGPMVEVGHQFGDWSRYPSLFSTGLGELFALDPRGHLLRWMHLGWVEGDDMWESGPRDLGLACKPSMVFAATQGPSSSVIVRDDPPGYGFCGWDRGTETASLLPGGLASPTTAPAPSVTFALLAGDRRLVRLVLGSGAPPVWTIVATADTSFLRVFTGNSFKPGSDENLYKYEWQWTFYDGKYVY